MSRIQWGAVGDKKYKAGVDRGVLYLANTDGEYDTGVAWNGLTTVTESPSGAESNKQYADNGVYANLLSAEQYDGTIEAFFSPPEFDECDGTRVPVPGIRIGQQPRRGFGFCFRNLIGDDVSGQEAGYELTLVWGALASPSEKAHNTLSDSPELAALSWDFSTTPIPVGVIDGTEYKPSSYLKISALEVDPTDLATLEDMLYGDSGTDPSLPTPADVVAVFEAGLTLVNLGTAANQPTYNAGTHVVTLPAVTGVQWKINGVNKAAGAQPAMSVGDTDEVTAHPQSGYRLSGDNDWTFNY
jgi:hypothetical protein